MASQVLEKRIKENEGFSQERYDDHLGFATIGYGHLITKDDDHHISLEKILRAV